MNNDIQANLNHHPLYIVKTKDLIYPNLAIEKVTDPTFNEGILLWLLAKPKPKNKI
jgi:hypothetical protein